MLKRIHVQGFKSLLNVEVELAPLVVVFGANAAGKSNLLESLLLLSRLVGERKLADAFKAPALRGYPVEAFSLPAGGLAELLTQDRAELSIEADVEPPEGEPLRYRAGVRIEPAQGRFALADEYLADLSDRKPSGHAWIEADAESRNLSLLSSEGGREHVELEGLGQTMASDLHISGRLYPALERLRNELTSWRSYFLDPREAMRSPQPPQDVYDIGSRGELIAPYLNRLHRMQQGKHFRAIRRALMTTIPTVEDLKVELDKQRGTLDIEIVQDGTPFSSRVISEGTLRVLALCAIAANPTPPSLVAFEEPENGVQPRRIQVIARLLAEVPRKNRTQLVVTTHSPTLIAEMAQMQMAGRDDILLLRCFREGEHTRLAPFDPAPLFRDPEIAQALSGPEDDPRVLESLLVRGWLDG